MRSFLRDASMETFMDLMLFPVYDVIWGRFWPCLKLIEYCDAN